MKGILPLRSGEDTFTPELVEAFLDEYTKPGDIVFDPFAGFGTTLVVAERMGRRPLGLEILADRVEFVRTKLEDPSVIRRSDARDLDRLDLPLIDFSLTSPPYMTREDHRQNPLTGYQALDGDYQTYLGDLAAIYEKLAPRLAPGATVVINAANLRSHATRLAWDIGQAVSTVLTYQQEVVIDWDQPPTWFTNDYCLVFSP
jgi:tRNA G10  N-methylase Trm11